MKTMVKTLAFLAFGLGCGALGQFGCYADFMENPALLLLLVVCGSVAFNFLSLD